MEEIEGAADGLGRPLVRSRDLEELVRVSKVRDCALMFKDSVACHVMKRRAAAVGSIILYQEAGTRLMTAAGELLRRLDASGCSAPSGMVLWADTLSHARGRMDRRWDARRGGLYLAVCFVPELLEERRDLYGLALGLSAAQVLREWGIGAEIRWINDVLIGLKKVAGVLMEQLTLPESQEEWIIAGLGINVNQPDFPKDLPWATSLFMEKGRPFPQKALGADIISRIGINFALLHEWEAEILHLQDLAPETKPPAPPMIHAYRRLCGFLGKRVIYGHDADRRPELTALALEILPDGRLLLETDEGDLIKASTGEIRFF